MFKAKVTDCKNDKAVKNQSECADCCDATFDSKKEKSKCKNKCLGSKIPNRCAQAMIEAGEMKKDGKCEKEQKSLDGCNGCCECRYAHLEKKIPPCKRKCSKKFKTNDPNSLQDVPNQYELDSFEIGTESAICEDCGEIHELEDEYEFGAHDEYEEVYSCKTAEKDRDKKCGRNGYISEPIPDYIMKGLQPKKSAHPMYGKLRY